MDLFPPGESIAPNVVDDIYEKFTAVRSVII